jgi:hypothetical protein
MILEIITATIVISKDRYKISNNSVSKDRMSMKASKNDWVI